MPTVTLILSLARDLARDPGDDAARQVLADLLAEAPPTPVERHVLPGWVRALYLRSVPPRLRPRRPHQTNGSVAQAIGAGELVSYQVGGHLVPAWDHWGSTTIAGMLCLVTEPYARPEAA